MTKFELPYSDSIVHSRKQARAFWRNVLMPTADRIANCSFQNSGLYQVGRQQDVSDSENPSDWTEIGFRAVRLDPRVRPRLVQFHIWAHVATDTMVIPLPEAAKKALSSSEPPDIHDAASVSALLVEVNGEDTEIDLGSEDTVVEEHGFYLDNYSYRPIRDLDYVFARDGNLIWQESHSDPQPLFWVGDNIREQLDLMRVERGLRNEFDQDDLRLMAGILGRLGLLS